MRFIFILLTMTVFTALPVYAQSISQEVIAPAGDEYTTNHLKIQWTIGEIAIEDHTNQDIRFTEGFHQPWIQVEEIQTFTRDLESNRKISLTIYPNPLLAEIYISLKEITKEELSIQLMDNNGTLLTTQALPSGSASGTMDMSSLPAGIYYVRINTMDQKEIAVHKLTKIQ